MFTRNWFQNQFQKSVWSESRLESTSGSGPAYVQQSNRLILLASLWSQGLKSITCALPAFTCFDECTRLLLTHSDDVIAQAFWACTSGQSDPPLLPLWPTYICRRHACNVVCWDSYKYGFAEGHPTLRSNWAWLHGKAWVPDPVGCLDCAF